MILHWSLIEVDLVWVVMVLPKFAPFSFVYLATMVEVPCMAKSVSIHWTIVLAWQSKVRWKSLVVVESGLCCVKSTTFIITTKRSSSLLKITGKMTTYSNVSINFACGGWCFESSIVNSSSCLFFSFSQRWRSLKYLFILSNEMISQYDSILWNAGRLKNVLALEHHQENSLATSLTYQQWHRIRYE